MNTADATWPTDDEDADFPVRFLEVRYEDIANIHREGGWDRWMAALPAEVRDSGPGTYFPDQLVRQADVILAVEAGNDDDPFTLAVIGAGLWSSRPRGRFPGAKVLAVRLDFGDPAAFEWDTEELYRLARWVEYVKGSHDLPPSWDDRLTPRLADLPAGTCVPNPWEWDREFGSCE